MKSVIVVLATAVLAVFTAVWKEWLQYLKLVKLRIRIVAQIVMEYFRGIPVLFYTHFAHQKYLYELGFGGNSKDLLDTGTIVWTAMEAEGNVLTVTNKPAPRVTGLVGNATGNIASMSISSLALKKLWKALNSVEDLSIHNSIFLDFGCGTGLAVISAMTQPFQQVIGVELHAGCAVRAEANVASFKMNKQSTGMIQCNDVTIHSMDMCDYDFKSLLVHSTTDSNLTLVLFMYEPLWTLAKSNAHEIYLNILSKAQQSGLRVIVAYFFCGMYSGNALPALFQLKAKWLKTVPYESLEFCINCELYIYEL